MIQRPSQLSEFDVAIPMRDGTVLRANIIRPADGTPAPVLLMRCPYPLQAARFDIDPITLAERGLALVLVSARGTSRSDGTFEPWLDDTDDGADTIAWCAARPWSTGRVLTIGRSYLAHTQLFAAVADPPALAAMAVSVVPSDPYALVYAHGVLKLGLALWWTFGNAGSALARLEERGVDVQVEQQQLAELAARLPGAYRSAPLNQLTTISSAFPVWQEWLDHPSRDDYWQQRALPDRPAIPTVVVAGWYDIFLDGSLAEFNRQPRHPGSRLVVGPWSHGLPGCALGDVDYGLAAAGFDLDARLLDFLTGSLHGTTSTDPPVRLFLTGANTWISAAAWPPPGTRDHTLFLRAGGGLRLSPPTADEAPVSEFTFDPRDPVPTRGGASLTPAGDAANLSGQIDQRPLDDRADVVRYATEPLAEPIDVVGVVILQLHAATDAVDTDWTAKLVDVHPDGLALNVADGVVRARYARTDSDPHLIEPCRTTEFRVEVGAIAHRFLPGHQIRLDVSSSNFPRLDRNPGTGATTATLAEHDFVIAHQTVHHSPDHPSRLVLPLLPKDAASP